MTQDIPEDHDQDADPPVGAPAPDPGGEPAASSDEEDPDEAEWLDPTTPGDEPPD